MMKRMLFVLLSLTLVLGVFGVRAEDPITLVYAEVNPLDSLVGQTGAIFKEKVEELTNGSVQIDIQASGVLGAEGDVLDTMIGGGGTIDIARIATFQLTNYGVKRIALLGLPYVFENRAHFWAFADSELGGELLHEAQEIGLPLRSLFYLEEGFRHFFFKNEVKELGDLAHKKIRVSTDNIMTGLVRSLKANPTVVSYVELYQSLSSGVIDGAEQPIPNYQSKAFHEVAPYLMLDGHTMGCGAVVMSQDSWDKLSSEQQEAVMKAAQAAREFNEKLSAEIEAKCLEELKVAGVTVVEVPDKKPWKEACQDLIQENIKGLEEDYQKIVDMAQ